MHVVLTEHFSVKIVTMDNRSQYKIQLAENDEPEGHLVMKYSSGYWKMVPMWEREQVLQVYFDHVRGQQAPR